MVIKQGQEFGRPVIVQLDPTKSPKHIDFILKTPIGQQSMRGIYKFDGDTRIICRVARGDRPVEFNSSATAMLLKYQRSEDQVKLTPDQLRIKFPAQSKNLQAGDEAIVCAEDAELLHDGKVLLKLPLGTRIEVSKVTDEHVFGKTLIDGVQRSGSILRKEVMSAPKAKTSNR